MCLIPCPAVDRKHLTFIYHIRKVLHSMSQGTSKSTTVEGPGTNQKRRQEGLLHISLPSVLI